MKNKHVIRCRISENKFRAIPRLFCLDSMLAKSLKSPASLDQQPADCILKSDNASPGNASVCVH
ncbi:hypothetical protein [Candidatus Spongiihabitans sp.]|uniref:hypothetical protein n=1 Tax=Candidatus Spongiihabitans sp. TaxID=3101308 RepID=UPI003C7BA14A